MAGRIVIVDYLLVYVFGLLSGGWAVAAGVRFGLDPVGVWVVASTGSLTFMVVALSVSGPIRDRLMAKFGGEDSSETVRSSLSVSSIGSAVWGLAAIGPVPERWSDSAC